jgi:serine/threonine protein kinase/tetratricopeptide (TPR) repeat protein
MIAPASRKLGKYEIRRKLGRGGMADVYLAHDTAFGYAVALKLIEHSADRDTCDAIEAERRGAGLQAHLAAIDPRVARVFDCGDIEGFFFVAMEYIDGQDLAELMHGGPLTPEFAADVAIAVAETLENAHNLQVAVEGRNIQGIVHGDIKPKNIRIDARGEVRVLDFGIAKALSLSRRLTRNEFGSVPYASPERLDSGEVSAHSDLWSLAVMLYEMVTGLQPYQAANTELLDRMIRSHIPPPPPPDPCPEPLRRILVKSMAAQPAQRYQTARAFADDLIAFRGGEMVRAAMDEPEPGPDTDRDATRRTWRAAKTDYGETRRTGPSAHNDGETRRTSGPLPAADAVPTVRTAAAKRPRTVFGTAMRAIAVFALITFLIGVSAAISDYFLYERGRGLERSIQTEQLTDPDQIWTKWTELSEHNPSSWILYWPRAAVKQKLVEAADHVIATYRNNEAQPIYQKDWERARTLLSRALSVDPTDTVRGELRLVEGHLARINGTAHRDPQELQTAVEKFNEAQHLLPKSPDPQLGLARVYVYGFKDIDKANEAMQEAAKRGYQPGNREKAQLADGYRDRANRLFWDSRNVRDMPQEKDQIQRAADDYKHALELYQSIAPYGNATTQITAVQSSLESVNSRLQQIEHPDSNQPEPKKLLQKLQDLIKSKLENGGNTKQN